MNGPSQAHAGLFLFVARAPIAGAAKTRLGAAVGMARAADLYAAFLRDLAARFLPRADEHLGYDIGWAFTPADQDFAATLVALGCERPSAGVRFVAQEGEGLAARLDNLFAWATAAGYGRTVIAATDSPHLPRCVAADALAVLEERDVVLGRTVDGGYYLIGQRGAHDILAGAPMSTGREADALVARAGALGLTVGELPETFDVDTAADLALLRAALAPDGAAAPCTWAALHALALDHVPARSTSG